MILATSSRSPPGGEQRPQQRQSQQAQRGRQEPERGNHVIRAGPGGLQQYALLAGVMALEVEKPLLNRDTGDVEAATPFPRRLPNAGHLVTPLLQGSRIGHRTEHDASMPDLESQVVGEFIVKQSVEVRSNRTGSAQSRRDDQRQPPEPSRPRRRADATIHLLHATVYRKSPRRAAETPKKQPRRLSRRVGWGMCGVFSRSRPARGTRSSRPGERRRWRRSCAAGGRPVCRVRGGTPARPPRL